MCRISLAVGDIRVRYQPAECDGRCHVRARYLLGHVAAVALALEVDDDTPDTPTPPALGFTAHIDLDPERNYEPDTSEWFEESP